MQQFRPPEEQEVRTATTPPPAGAELPERELKSAPALDLEAAAPRRDVSGRTLDDALGDDRRVRERVLRRARQVVRGMRNCDQGKRVGLQVARAAWVPLTKYLNSLAPRTLGQSFLLLGVLCCCWVPLLYIGGGLVALGALGSALGISIWFVATVTRAALGWYFRYLIPWW